MPLNSTDGYVCPYKVMIFFNSRVRLFHDVLHLLGKWALSKAHGEGQKLFLHSGRKIASSASAMYYCSCSGRRVFLEFDGVLFLDAVYITLSMACSSVSIWEEFNKADTALIQLYFFPFFFCSDQEHHQCMQKCPITYDEVFVLTLILLHTQLNIRVSLHVS